MQATSVTADELDFGDDLLAEMPIVLTATRLAQPLNEAPISTSVIDEEMISASGAQNIPDLFRLIPGFQVFYSNSNEVGVVANGLDEHASKRMQVLINGRSVYLPTTGGVPWGDLPIVLDDIKRIEIVRGPNAASYGANAFLGVINIITKHSVEDYGTSLKLAGGYNGQGRVDLRHGGSRGDLDFHFGISGLSDDGFINRHDGRETAIINGRLDYQATPNDIIFVEAGYTKGVRKDGQADSELNNPHSINTFYNFQQLQWDHSFSSENSLKLQFSHQYHERDNNYRTEGVFPLPLGNVYSYIDFDYYGHRYDTELSHRLSIGDHTRIVLGGGARLDQVHSAGYLGTDKTLDNKTLKLFGNIETHLTESLMLNAGVMYEDNESAGNEYSPRVGLLYHLTPNNTLRTSFSKASRNPVLYEESANAVINYCSIPLSACFDQPIAVSAGSIKSEIIRTSEAGWHYNDDSRRLQLDLRYFHTGMRRMIGKVDDEDENPIFLNLDHTTTEGIELEADYKPFKNTRIHLAYARAETKSTDISNDGIEDATPENSFSLLLIQSLPYNSSISGNYYYMDEIHGLGSGDTTGPIDRLDLKLSKGLSSSIGRSEISLTLQNVFDDEYVEYDRQNLFERRIYMELNHHF